MPKFIVNASEVVWYAIEIEADSKDDALEKAYNINVNDSHIVGGDQFQIENIEEVTNA